MSFLQLIDFLSNFHNDRNEDEQFNDEKAYLIKQVNYRYISSYINRENVYYINVGCRTLPTAIVIIEKFFIFIDPRTKAISTIHGNFDTNVFGLIHYVMFASL